MAGTHSEQVNTVLLCIKGDKRLSIMSVLINPFIRAAAAKL